MKTSFLFALLLIVSGYSGHAQTKELTPFLHINFYDKAGLLQLQTSVDQVKKVVWEEDMAVKFDSLTQSRISKINLKGGRVKVFFNKSELAEFEVTDKYKAERDPTPYLLCDEQGNIAIEHNHINSPISGYFRFNLYEDGETLFDYLKKINKLEGKMVFPGSWDYGLKHMFSPPPGSFSGAVARSLNSAATGKDGLKINVYSNGFLVLSIPAEHIKKINWQKQTYQLDEQTATAFSKLEGLNFSVRLVFKNQTMCKFYANSPVDSNWPRSPQIQPPLLCENRSDDYWWRFPCIDPPYELTLSLSDRTPEKLKDELYNYINLNFKN